MLLLKKDREKRGDLLCEAILHFLIIANRFKVLFFLNESSENFIRLFLMSSCNPTRSLELPPVAQLEQPLKRKISKVEETANQVQAFLVDRNSKESIHGMQFPSELIVLILHFLPVGRFSTCALVCREWQWLFQAVKCLRIKRNIAWAKTRIASITTPIHRICALLKIAQFENCSLDRRLTFQRAKETVELIEDVESQDEARLEILKVEAGFELENAIESIPTIVSPFIKVRALLKKAEAELGIDVKKALETVQKAKKTIGEIEDPIDELRALLKVCKLEKNVDMNAAKVTLQEAKDLFQLIEDEWAVEEEEDFLNNLTERIVRIESLIDIESAKRRANLIENSSMRARAFFWIVRTEACINLENAKKTLRSVLEPTEKCLSFIELAKVELEIDVKRAKKSLFLAKASCQLIEDRQVRINLRLKIAKVELRIDVKEANKTLNIAKDETLSIESKEKREATYLIFLDVEAEFDIKKAEEGAGFLDVSSPRTVDLLLKFAKVNLKRNLEVSEVTSRKLQESTQLITNPWEKSYLQMALISQMVELWKIAP